MRESIKLGESTYYVRPMPPFQGLRVLGDLQNKFGPGLSELLEDDLSFTGRQVAAAATRLSMTLPGDEMERLARMLLDPECVSVEGGGEPAVKLDAAAQTRHLRGAHDIIALCVFVFQVNYRPFWQEEGNPISGAISLLRANRPGVSAPS